MTKNQCLKELNKFIILPDEYSFVIDDNDYYTVYLFKNSKKIETFILHSYSQLEIIEFGLEVGEYLK